MMAIRKNYLRIFELSANFKKGPFPNVDMRSRIDHVRAISCSGEARPTQRVF